MKHRFLKALVLTLFVMASYGLRMFSKTISDDNTRLIFSLVSGLSIGIVCAVIYKQFK